MRECPAETRDCYLADIILWRPSKRSIMSPLADHLGDDMELRQLKWLVATARGEYGFWERSRPTNDCVTDEPAGLICGVE
jgi:hypothetical protein